MKIASWNVNSLKVRLPHVLTWLKMSNVDVLALQETKCTDENFPKIEIESAGFYVIFSGQKTYNGVAIIAKQPINDVVSSLANFDDIQKRVLFATINGVRIMNIYVPNGSEVGSEKYIYKLNWLTSLQQDLITNLTNYENLVLLGDFNIAPENRDVYNPEKLKGKILCSHLERLAYQQLLDTGMVDTFLQSNHKEKLFSWWDYRQAAFRRNMGMRIDFVLASTNLAKTTKSCIIDTEPRKWQRPSDHTPVIANFKL